MPLRIELLLLPIVALVELAQPVSATQGRRLLQVANTGNPVISFEDALIRRLPEPVDWNAYTVEIRSAYQLRAAICESNGDVYMQDPITDEDRDYCYKVGDEPKKISVIVREDLYLRGMKLPPIEHFFKIDGRCDDEEADGDTICAIHATSALCSACPLPSEDTQTDDMVICDACKFGQAEGRETTPFRVEATAKLWLENVEIAGCKTEGSGGCVKLAKGDRKVWYPDNDLGNDITYLDAKNCRFRRGYAEGEGGAVFMQSGSLAFFQDTTFLLNFAKAQGQTTQGQTADKSYDIMIRNFAATVLIDCVPINLHVKSTQVLPGTEKFLEPYQVGQYFIVVNEEVEKKMEELDLITDSKPSAPQSPPSQSPDSSPSPSLPPGVILPSPPPPVNEGENNGAADSNGAIPIGALIAIVLASIIAGGGGVVCCWWCCADPTTGNDDEDDTAGLEIGPKQKSMFIRVKETRGSLGRGMKSWKSNFTTRFQSAFKSFMRNGGDSDDEEGNVRRKTRFHIPGTDKMYTTEQLMRGRINNWTGDPDRDEGALPQERKSIWKSGFGLKDSGKKKKSVTISTEFK